MLCCSDAYELAAGARPLRLGVVPEHLVPVELAALSQSNSALSSPPSETRTS